MSKQLLRSVFLVLFFILGLCSCDINSSGSGNLIPPNNSDSDLGLLNNGSIVYVSSAEFTTSSNGDITGSVGITEGLTTYQGVVTFKVRAAAGNHGAGGVVPTISTSPVPCVLNSSAPENLCQVVMSGANAAAGTYIITPTITNNGVAQALNNFTLMVSGSVPTPTPTPTVSPSPTSTPTVSPSPTSIPTVSPSPTPTPSVSPTPPPVPGKLVVRLSKKSLEVGESTTAIVTLNQFTTIPNVPVRISSGSTNVATITGNNSCTLSTAHTSCTFNVKALAKGTSDIIAISTKPLYSQGSATLSVGAVPGSITLSLAATPILIGESTTATITLNHAIDVTNLPITITSESAGIASVISSTCTIKSSVAPNNTCMVTIAAGVESGTTTIAAISPGYKQATQPIEVLVSGWVLVGGIDPAYFSDEGEINALIADKNNVYIGIGGGLESGMVLKSNENESWSAIASSVNSGFMPDGYTVTSVILDGQGNIYAGTTASASSGGNVWKHTIIGGRSVPWQQVCANSVPDGGNVLTISYQEGVIYAGTNGDGGSGTVFSCLINQKEPQWHDPAGSASPPFVTMPDNGTVVKVLADKSYPDYYYAATDYGNVYAITLGHSWETVGKSVGSINESGLLAEASTASTGGELYAIGSNNTQVDAVGIPPIQNNNWFLYNSAPLGLDITALAVQGFVEPHLFIATSNGIYRENSSFTGWVQSGGVDLPWEGTVNFIALTIDWGTPDNGNLYVATSNNVYKCLAECGQVW